MKNTIEDKIMKEEREYLRKEREEQWKRENRKDLGETILWIITIIMYILGLFFIMETDHWLWFIFFLLLVFFFVIGITLKTENES